MYDAREKALRDYQSAISSALMEGIEKGRLERLAEVRAEGERRGILIGRIEAFQEFLGLAPTGWESLRNLPTSDLEQLAVNLQKIVRERATPSS